MTGKRLLTVTIVTVIGLAASTGLQAQQQDASTTTSEVAELYQRLDAAESTDQPAAEGAVSDQGRSQRIVRPLPSGLLVLR